MDTQRLRAWGHYLILGLLLSVTAPAVALTSGVPLETSLNPLTYSNTTIEVPAGATRLTVTIRNGSGDLDLHLKKGSPVTGNTASALEASADISAVGLTADETIELTPSTTPALTAGTWYIASVNWENFTNSFTLTATVETGGSTGSGGTGGTAGNNGIPAGFTIQTATSFDVFAFNISNSSFTDEDVDGLMTLAVGLLGSAGGDGAVTTYSPAELRAMGYDGTQLHDWLLPIANFFTSYTNIVVGKQVGPYGSVIRLAATRWSSSNPNGIAVGAIEIPEALPFEQLLGLLGGGTQYLKVVTSNSGANLRLELFIQQTLSSLPLFLLAAEGNQAYLGGQLGSAIGSLDEFALNSSSPHPGSGGIPTGFTIESANGLAVFGFNFGAAFTMQEVGDWFGIGALIAQQLGGDGLLTLYTPDQLLSWGFNGIQLHNFLLGLVSDFSMYANIVASRTNANSRVRLAATLWSSSYPAGISMGHIEIADPPPASELLTLITPGTRYIGITSSTPGGTSLQLDFSFLASSSSPALFMASLAITQAFLTELFSSLVQ